MSDDRPNILFLFSDQHAQNVAGCYGAPIVQTPALDQLAAEGVTFDNAYTTAPLCTPARMAMLTAQYSHKIGCWTNSDILASDIPTHAHSLGAAGYRPTLIGRLHSIGPDQLHGYVDRRVGDHSTNWVGGHAHGMGVLDRAQEPFRVSLERSGPGQSAYEVKDRDVLEATLAYLDEIKIARKKGDKKPFAATVGLMLPHQPYVCSPEDFSYYDGKVGLPRLAAPGDNAEHPYLREWRRFTDSLDLPDDWQVRARTAYYGLTTAMDRMIQQILDRLEANGLADNTLVVYASDHGDQLGERGLWWKQTFHEQSIKVPLIMRWAGRLPTGERRSQVVNLLDLASTMLDAAGAPPLPKAQGRSFLEVARDQRTPWSDLTFAEYCTDGLARWTGAVVQQRMVREGRYKLVYYHGHRPQLFDLEADPDETVDLAQSEKHAGVRDALVARVLDGWDPDEIALEQKHRIANKRLLSDWARTAEPDEAHRWDLKMEDNWLAEQAS
ncbi:MAG: sulfatase-like hydrolase/transferase [Geminicoccales bacterium]